MPAETSRDCEGARRSRVTNQSSQKLAPHFGRGRHRVAGGDRPSLSSCTVLVIVPVRSALAMAFNREGSGPATEDVPPAAAQHRPIGPQREGDDVAKRAGSLPRGRRTPDEVPPIPNANDLDPLDARAQWALLALVDQAGGRFGSTHGDSRRARRRAYRPRRRLGPASRDFPRRPPLFRRPARPLACARPALSPPGPKPVGPAPKGDSHRA